MSERTQTYLVVGLGLLGGKYARELTRAGYRVEAIDINQASLDWALEQGYIAAGATCPSREMLARADHMVFGLYPTAFLEWIREYGQDLPAGLIFTDVSGVKQGLVEPIQQMLPPGVEFIASHPMAGKEVSGVQNAARVEFAGANFIITPTEKNTPQAIAWCRELAATLGFTRITCLSLAQHDAMIGYVSQLCHAIAVSLMCASDNAHLAQYTGDSFRDLTRIAKINEKMWAELFLWNKENLIAEIDQFDSALQEMKQALLDGDRDHLEEMFRLSTRRRTAFDQD